MELDFTKLEKLGKNLTENEPAEAASNAQEPHNEAGQGETVKQQESALNHPKTALKRLQKEADQAGAELERARAVYREYQEAIKKTGALQTEILKGLNQGQNIYALFLKAVEALSLTTSNKAFYSQVEATIRAVYGEGLLEPLALNIEIQNAQERLKRLIEAEKREQYEDSKERIKKAIKAHKEQIERLKEMTEKTHNFLFTGQNLYDTLYDSTLNEGRDETAKDRQIL